VYFGIRMRLRDRNRHAGAVLREIGVVSRRFRAALRAPAPPDDNRAGRCPLGWAADPAGEPDR